MGGRHRSSESNPVVGTGGSPFNVSGFGLSDVSSTHESAEEEKKRLEREEREKVLAAAATTGPGPSRAPTVSRPQYETAKEEKSRLEREERERYVLFLLVRSEGFLI